MAYEATDGKKFTNRPPMMSHNRSMAAKSSAGGAGQQVDPLAQPSEGEGMEQDGKQVAMEHGPANEVHMQHDHAAGEHHVHSMHPDGHEHHSDHGSAEEAHEHGKDLASDGGGEMGGGDCGGMEAEYE